MRLIVKQLDSNHIMANICNNQFYAYSEDPENIRRILDFFNNWSSVCHGESTDDTVELYFESKWVFPEEEMITLFQLIPNKSDIYMRCLSVEYGCMYHALWYCDEDGWHLS